jgi:hypothetical protein
LATFLATLKNVLISTKMGWAIFRAIFSQAHLVTLHVKLCSHWEICTWKQNKVKYVHVKYIFGMYCENPERLSYWWVCWQNIFHLNKISFDKKIFHGRRGM